MNWLEEIVHQHSELESPATFWYWSAVAAISAVVKDSVWLGRQIYNLYPNIYVMLHADSGLKKGPPISMAAQLVKCVNNTRIIRGRSSIQGILKEMGTSYSVPGGKVPITKAVAFICSSELSSSIVEDKVATTILTDLYDRQYNVGEWRSLLKMETFNLKDPTITMLTATNEAHSDDFFNKKDIQGGYFARTFIIYESKRNKTNSLVFPLSHPPNIPQSAAYLRQLSTLNGPFQPLAEMEQSDIHSHRKLKDGRVVWFSAAGLMYDDWYEDFLHLVDQQEIRDPTGTLNRFGDSVLKVAMLLALANKPELIITEQAMTEAITVCEKFVGNIRRATIGKQGISNTALLKTLLIHEMLTRPNNQATRAVLMKKYWMHYSTPQEWDEIMQSFDSSGMIVTTSVGNQVLYTMPETQATEMKRFLEGKMERK